MKTSRISLGLTDMNDIRNEIIRGTTQVEPLEEKVREARLSWFGHIQRRKIGDIGWTYGCTWRLLEWTWRYME